MNLRAKIHRLLRVPARIRQEVSNARFRALESSIHPQTRRVSMEVLTWAEERAKASDEAAYDQLWTRSDDPIVHEGGQLRRKVLAEFKGKLSSLSGVRVLIHLPDQNQSPGGYSLFTNLIQSIVYLGVPCRALAWNEPVQGALSSFAPTVLLTSDSESWLRQIAWDDVRAYQRSSLLLLGLTASLQEYGNTPLLPRLRRAEELGVEFFYSFRAPEYVRSRTAYRPFFDREYEILHVEFGANPLTYYPVPGIERDIAYVFLGSTNSDKHGRYASYFGRILSQEPGIVDGPGWRHAAQFQFMQDRDRYVYARARVGLNLHVQSQLQYASELNERTYMLAACGVPQLLDNPMLLRSRFPSNCFFVGQTPTEYDELFHDITSTPQIAQNRALSALREVYDRHTTFHRAEAFLKGIGDHVEKRR